MSVTAKKFEVNFLRLIALTWLLPPMLGFAFMMYIEIFTIDQLVPMMTTPLELVFVIGGFILALLYFKHFIKPLTLYLNTPNSIHKSTIEETLKRFPLRYWIAFLCYISMAPAITLTSLEISTDFKALPVDWFRVHLVALIVSIIVGLPIFVSINDLLGRTFRDIKLKRPVTTIKTKVFLIGALIPLLIDTMLVQYYWTRTGFFNSETFVIWLLLEVLAIVGALLFVRSFNQSLTPLNDLTHSNLNTLENKIKPASLDELGILTTQLSELLDEQQFHKQRLAFSNELLKSSHSYESLAKLLETVVNRTCKTLHGDISFLSLYDTQKDQLVCVAHSQGGYNAEGHFQIALDEKSINTEVFRTSKPQITDDVPAYPNAHTQLIKTFSIKSSATVPLISNNKTIGVLQIATTEQHYHYNEQEVKTLQAYAQEAALIQTLFNEVKQRHKAEAAITKIMQAVSTTTGTDFFNAITRHMAEILHADSCAIVATVADSTDTVEALAHFHDGKISSNICYSLKGGPCETIINKEIRTYASHLQEHFPEDNSLKESGMESYVGIPLFNSQKKPLGLLFAMFRRQIEDIEFNESVMCIFAARTVAEIERCQSEKSMKRMAYYDDLTQLPNRAYLLDRLQHDMNLAQRHQTRLAVIMMDLDHFKNINDSLGHPVGDRLLIEVARRLKKCMRKEDTVARLGGDEFIILQSDFDNREAAINHISHMNKELLKTLKDDFSVADHTLMVTASFGIALYPDDGETTEQLIKHADTALYKAKAQGRDNFQFFSSEMNVAATERLQMESDIYQAINNDEFYVVYQPKVCILDNKIIGAEALLRWKHPELGNISPEQFIPIADETGQIIQLGEFIMQQACSFTNELWCSQNSCQELGSISVNVSPRQFQQYDFVSKFQQILSDTNTSPCCMELEITENILINDTHKASEKLNTIKNMGLKISIDDFGTGYASLRYLQQLPIDLIKIDRSFITHITTNTNDLAIVKTILNMAKNLSLNVIAEGVETAEQLELLKQLGCSFYQGYYFSKPLSKEQLSELIKKQRETN